MALEIQALDIGKAQICDSDTPENWNTTLSWSMDFERLYSYKQTNKNCAYSLQPRKKTTHKVDDNMNMDSTIAGWVNALC